MAPLIQPHQETQSDTQVSNLVIPEKISKSESSIHCPVRWKITYEYQDYVCLIDNSVLPNKSRNPSTKHDMDYITEEDESEPALDRTNASHKLDLNDMQEEASICQTPTIADRETITNNESDDIDTKKQNIIKLIRMKWFCDEYSECSPSVSPSTSSSSSNFSRGNVEKSINVSEKTLATILNLDKEHKMFGLSDIFIMGSLKKSRKSSEDGPVFPQTAIVQICQECCKHKSTTDLPASLKCGSCFSCTTCGYQLLPPSCGSCISYRGFPVPIRKKCSCHGASTFKKCSPDCNQNFGLTITVNRKPEFETTHVEVTPRSSCILSKPLAARSCYHCPPCVPPSSCFPYLGPCFWPSRPSAPCATPARCFHNPPCLPKRQKKVTKDPHAACPEHGLCTDKNEEERYPKCPNKYGTASKDKCNNPNCPGKIPGYKNAIKNKFENQAEIKNNLTREKSQEFIITNKNSPIKSAIKSQSPQ